MKKTKFSKYKKISIFILIIISTFSLFSIFKYKQNEKNDIFIPVLMYHNLDQNPDFKKITYTIKPHLFEKHMKALKKSGYSTITATELNDYIYNNATLPRNPILLTFDDGKTNNYEYVYPVLKNLDMKGTMFAIVHKADRHRDEEYLDWNRLKEMNDSGVIDIQSHTYNLHYKIDNKPMIFNKTAKESDEDYKKRILADFKLSKKLIEKNIGNKVVSLAYPYGGYNEDIEKISKQAGYKQTYTTDVGVMKKSDSPYSIKRINIDGLCSEKRLIIEIELLKILNSIF